MKTEHLHDLWAGPDNSRLTTKQFSFRLPVHIAAKLAALCEMYPQKNRTQIVADLLTSALDDLERQLPQSAGEPAEPGMYGGWEEQAHREFDEEGVEPDPLYYLGGPRGRFRMLANRHYRELEAELGNDQPAPLFEIIVGTLADLQK